MRIMQYYAVCPMINKIVTVLHIMPSILSPAGTPRKLLSLVQNCNREKFRHVFLLFCNHADNLSEAIRRAGGIVEEVTRPRNYDVRLLSDIIKIIRKYKVNIINTHFARADIYGAVAGSLLGIPVIKSVHSIVWNGSFLLQKIDGLLSQLRVCTLCNSEATRRAVISQTGSKNTKVIYNGVPNHAVYLTPDQKKIKRNELDLPSDAFVTIHVGGMIGLREQAVIIKAVKKCTDAGMDIYHVFVGDGPLRKNLEAESRELGLDRRVRFLGYRRDVPELNAMSDVFVNTAREEGFGIAVVEAMQAGLPVVLANAGALPELIEEGACGLLVPPGDAGALASALITLAENPVRAQLLGAAGQKRAEHSFSIQRYVQDMENLYFEVASGGKDK